MRLARWLVALALFSLAPRARAEIDFARAVALLSQSSAERGVLPRGVLPAMRRPGSSRVALLAERRGPGDPPRGAVPIGDLWFALDVEESGARALGPEHPGFRFHWSPPRRLLLDRAAGWTRAASFRAETGLSGRGVAIGIIDSGVDLSHPDLRRADGSTRVRWLIDLGRPPRGREPELEALYGCSGDNSCAIYAAADLDELLANGVAGDEPRDSFGHGTHVASLAAGNGLSSSPPRYLGVAPEADLIIARMAQAESGIVDADVLIAAAFVFERAAALGEPVVLNLSLGSDFGAHDGSSPLEQALSSFVGPGQPGRAIVVAAGNSAGLYDDDIGYPGPLGVHTEAHVPRASPVTLPLLMLGGAATIQATVYVWIGFREGDDVAVGLDLDGKEWVPPTRSGSGGTYVEGALRASVLSGVESVEAPLRRGEPSAVLVIEGEWNARRRFDVRLEGRGSASLWVQSAGDLDPSIAPGALFPFASKQGTINVPATAPALIAVGATLNRTEWVDAAGESIRMAAHGALDDAPPDTTGFFSSAGPNALGGLKPDIVAPGAQVIGAMSALADPRRSTGLGLFSSAGRCPSQSECYVVDDHHGVSSGTSMASPIVAGAVALLFERDPGLTQDAVRALLQAGARPLEGEIFAEQQSGPGALDLEGTLAAQIAESSPVLRVPSARSWVALSESYAHPDPDWPLHGLCELRAEDGSVADGFDARRLELRVRGADTAEPLTRLAPGLYRFVLAAPAASGGTTIELALAFDGEELVRRSVPVAVDRGAATELVTLRGGCGLSARPSSGKAAIWLLLALTAAARRARFRRSRLSPPRDFD